MSTSFLNTIHRELQAKRISESTAKEIRNRLMSPFVAAPETQKGHPETEREHATKMRTAADELFALLCANQEVVENLSDTLANIAHGLISNIAGFVLQSASQTLISVSHARFQSEEEPNKELFPLTTLAQIAQCLFLLTSRYQATEAHVKELIGLFQHLLTEKMMFFPDDVSQTPLMLVSNALMYFVLMALCNVLRPYGTFRSASSTPTTNLLLRSPAVGDKVLEWVNTFRSQVTQSSPGLPLGGAMQHIDGYLSILTLACAMFFMGTGMTGLDERASSRTDVALDLALEAFVGGKTGGKVCKWLVRLAPPLSAFVTLPRYVFCDAYFQMITYIFHEMLPVVKHVADLDVESYRHFVSTSSGPTAIASRPSEVVTAHRKLSFTSSIRHLLQLIAFVMEELPVRYIEPDHVTDPESFWEGTDITLFVWRHMVLHLNDVFDTQRQPRKWEVYTLKLVSSYLDVVTVMCRNESYAKQIYSRFETFLGCSEMQWPSLIHQCREGVRSVGAAGDPRIGETRIQGTQTFGGRSGARQLSISYYAKHFVQFASKIVFLLSEICMQSPGCIPDASKVLTVDEVFGLLGVPNIDQAIFGASLGYLSSLIKSAEAYGIIWRRIEAIPLLKSSSHFGLAESQDLRAMFQEECRKGRFAITKGALMLLLSSFSFSLDASVLRYLQFIVDDVFCGFTRRMYVAPLEKCEVGALAAATILRGFDLNVLAGYASPLNALMPGAKGTDVVNEIHRFLQESYLDSASLGQLPAKNVCLCKCLQLAAAMRRLSSNATTDPTCSMITRAFHSEDFLCSIVRCIPVGDLQVRSAALALCRMLSGPQMCSVARSFFSSHEVGFTIQRFFFQYLDPNTELTQIEFRTAYPRSLAILEVEEPLRKNIDEIRLGMIDLLIANATVAAPSLTSYLCGYGPNPVMPIMQPSCLQCILHSVNDACFCELLPQVAAKYVKLVYLLIRNPTTWTDGLRKLLRCRDAQEYMEAVYLLGPNASVADLDRFGYILKTLSLEVFDAVDVDFVERHLRNMFARQTTKDETSEGLLQDTPTFAAWLGIALSRTPLFPTLPSPPQAPVTIHVDGIPQYDIVALYSAFTSSSSAKSMHEMRSFLSPYIAANDVLLAHSAVLNFLEGWCEVVSIVCSRVNGVTTNLVLVLLWHCLGAMPQATKLNAETQHRAMQVLSGTAVSLLSAIRQLWAPNEMSSAQSVLPDEVFHDLSESLLNALLVYANHSSFVRHNIYSCFVMLLSLPGRKCETQSIARVREPFLACLIDDCVSKTVALQVTALRTLQQLVCFPGLAESFVTGSSGLFDVSMVCFIERMFQSVDEVVHVALGICSADDSSRAAYLIDAFFSALKQLAYTQSNFLHHANAVQQLASMKSWSACCSVIGGGPAEHGEAFTNIISVRDTARRLTFGALSWLSVQCRHSLLNSRAIYAVAELIRKSKHMFTQLFSSPFLSSASTSNIYITSQLLEILYEAAKFMHSFSCAEFLRDAVPQLIELFQFVPLLHLLLHRDTRLGRHFVSDDRPTARNAYGGLATNTASRRQSQLLAETARCLLLFILNCTDSSEGIPVAADGVKKRRSLGPSAIENYCSLVNSIAAAHDESSESSGARAIYLSCLEIVVLILQSELLGVRRDRSRADIGINELSRTELVKVIDRFAVPSMNTCVPQPEGLLTLAGDVIPPTVGPSNPTTKGVASARSVLLNLRRLLTEDFEDVPSSIVSDNFFALSTSQWLEART